MSTLLCFWRCSHLMNANSCRDNTGHGVDKDGVGFPATEECTLETRKLCCRRVRPAGVLPVHLDDRVLYAADNVMVIEISTVSMDRF